MTKLTKFMLGDVEEVNETDKKYTEYGFLNPNWKESGYKQDPDWKQGWADKDGYHSYEEEGKFHSYDAELEYPAPNAGEEFMAVLRSSNEEGCIRFECSPWEAERMVMGLSCLYESISNKMMPEASRILYLREQVMKGIAEYRVLAEAKHK